MKKKWLTGHPYGYDLKKVMRIMRLTVLLLFGCILTVSASTYAQKTRLDINMNNTTIRDLFAYIEENSEFVFLYQNDDFNLEKKVEINLTNASINQILDEALKGENVKYDVYARQIVIQKISDAESGQQKKDVSGSVKDIKGAPVPGATVVVKGTNVGVITDVNGEFKFSVPGSATTLVFSFVGMKTQEVPIAGTTFNIVMQEETIDIGDVVAIGYGKGSKKNLSSAISSVSSDQLNQGAISDVGQLIQGKVPGLNISSSGDPTKNASVILRGASTLNSSMSPFYVIDGVPGADISMVSPDDIATIDVLKDAAATAIYGNRAANGVIMITTKKGGKDKNQISYHGYVGVEKVSNQLDMMNASQLRSFLEKNNMNFSPEDDLGANTNWQNEILRPSAISTSHNISLSGGNDHSSYLASLTYLKKQGIMLSSEQQRVIAHLSIEQMAFDDKLKLGLNVTNSNTTNTNVPQRNVALLQAIHYLPVSPVKNEDGTYFENFNQSGYFNPLALINHADDDTKYNNMVGNATAELKLPFGLTYNLNVAYQKTISLHGEYYDSYYSDNYNSANFYNNPDPPATKYILNFGDKGLALRNTYQTTNVILESYLTWNAQFGKHGIKAVVGYSWQQDVSGEGFQSTNTNFPVDNTSYNNLALGNYSSVSGYTVDFGDDASYQKIRMISDFGRLNYNYDNKYLIQGSIRRDGSSVFGENKRWGYFPAVGVAWRVDQEGFMKGNTLFSDLKLRASYGITGNSSGFNAYTAQFISSGTGTFYYNGSQTGAYGPVQAANYDLGWEKTATSNLGVDFGVPGGKLSGTVEVYNKKTTDMIYSYAVDPMLVPTGSIVANGGSMSNKGIEITVNATPVEKENFRWTTSLNLAHNKNEITKLENSLFAGGDSTRRVQPDGGGQTGSTIQIYKEGKPIGQFFTLQYAGKNSEGVSQYVAADGSLTTNPSIGVDYRYLGSAQPKVLLGWNNMFRYKNFDLNIFIRGVFGNKIFNVTRADLFRPSTANSANILTDVANESPDDYNAYKYSDRFIENGNYIRLDNATLGYNIPKFSSYVNSLRVYLSVNNLFVITKYSGIDPEIEQGGNAPGVDSNNFYPRTRSMILGVKVEF